MYIYIYIYVVDDSDNGDDYDDGIIIIIIDTHIFFHLLWKTFVWWKNVLGLTLYFQSFQC